MLSTASCHKGSALKNKNFRLFDPEMAGNDGFNATVRYISEQIPAPATVLARLQIQF